MRLPKAALAQDLQNGSCVYDPRKCMHTWASPVTQLLTPRCMPPPGITLPHDSGSLLLQTCSLAKRLNCGRQGDTRPYYPFTQPYYSFLSAGMLSWAAVASTSQGAGGAAFLPGRGLTLLAGSRGSRAGSPGSPSDRRRAAAPPLAAVALHLLLRRRQALGVERHEHQRCPAPACMYRVDPLTPWASWKETNRTITHYCFGRRTQVLSHPGEMGFCVSA